MFCFLFFSINLHTQFTHMFFCFIFLFFFVVKLTKTLSHTSLHKSLVLYSHTIHGDPLLLSCCYLNLCDNKRRTHSYNTNLKCFVPYAATTHMGYLFFGLFFFISANYFYFYLLLLHLPLLLFQHLQKSICVR